MRIHALLLSTLLPAAATAQDVPIILETITLDAGLSPIEVQAYGRANTVLTAEEISSKGVRNVQDALRAVPGLAVSSSGASNTQLRIRGAEGNHTLILIDGVRAAAGDSEYFLSGLDIANIDRIEVLRGPQSVFFGADASAGVVNIITRQPATGSEAGGAVEIGNGWAASAYASTRGDRGGVALNLSARDDKGYDHSGTPGGEADGIRRKAVSLSFDHRLTEALTAGVMLRRADEEYDYDDESWTASTAGEYVVDAAGQADRDETAGQVWLEIGQPGGRLSHRLSYDRTDFALSQSNGTRTEARTDIWKYRGIFGLDGAYDTARQTLSIGAERRRDENSITTSQNRRSNSAIIEYRGSFADALDLQLGLRHDDNEIFKDATTWSLGLSYALPNAPVRIHASAGTGVVNPTYSEQFGGFGYIGNPDLKPEENRGFDIGVETEFLGGRGLIDVTYFHEKLENEISFNGLPLPDGTNYLNLSGTSTRRGVEMAAQLQASDRLSFGASYTYLDAKAPDGQVETRRPRHTLGLTAAYLFAEGRGSVSGELLHVAGNYDTQFFGSFATEELDDYTLVNVAGGYDLTERVRLTGRVKNLFDADYTEVFGYATQGRTAYLGLEARW
ncbi:vitamin B12 transporter [Paracoccus isoporae]|uniref:Vitamin B12 transporter n=1 Tax=Paracoccus isoporae TaxID=591205 RepID=A0A1G6TUY4_9RHOB|nr:TonB-dependent receptor [Paracoccus isoporae]SDD32849.1 vitamin B12 transporter [Paracoccus isoporae]